MKHYLTIAALSVTAALFSLPAVAQTQTAEKTRAQVSAELAQARASGEFERMQSIGFGLPEPLVHAASPRRAAQAANGQASTPQASKERPATTQVRADAR